MLPLLRFHSCGVKATGVRVGQMHVHVHLCCCLLEQDFPIHFSQLFLLLPKHVLCCAAAPRELCGIAMCIGCRGILIAALTNRARTQMAEGALRSLTAGTVFIKSGGVHHEGALHPLAIKVMQDVGVDISGQSVTSLESARRQQTTYDVYISVDCSYKGRSLDRSLNRFQVTICLDCHPGVVTPSVPAMRIVRIMLVMWVTFNAASEQRKITMLIMRFIIAMRLTTMTMGSLQTSILFLCPPRRPIGVLVQTLQTSGAVWEIWSPRDPSIFHERSTRKFQDHFYEGEPFSCDCDSALCVLVQKFPRGGRWMKSLHDMPLSAIVNKSLDLFMHGI
uniref:Phosphotyrosine protein phosphatase I domain-containing protein n=1 Tax=Trypanosoma vivax (strain Y486) TaxID=1055687 RepID=G0U1Y4_TRYVY|nr:conserved hypothetical protein [Trypanosoma vivax Y486]